MERPSGRMTLPMWGVPGLPMPTPPPSTTHSSAVLNSCYEPTMFSSDMSPLRRKKISSLMITRDTPILRTVLGQGQADSSQPVPLVCRPDSHLQNHSNGSPNQETEKPMKSEQMPEDAPSPYTDISMMEEETERNSKMMMQSSSPQSMYSECAGSVSSGIATYVPTQKPEWKRYKQYTRNDIMSAIEAVRTGMSALQAARKYGVPSRTLYDKVKKLGITTSRPFRRSSNGNGSVGFPYSLGSSGGAMFGGSGAEDESGGGYGSVNKVEYGFLHHPMDSGGSGKERDMDREAISSLQASNQGCNLSGNSSSPNNMRSPSPNLIKYAHRNSMTPSPPPQPPSGNEDEDNMKEMMHHDDMIQDQVEDLSVTRKPDPPPPQPTSRVIMPPMSEAAATLLTTGNDSHQNNRD